ncbi:hypothetical protein HQ305_16480 [Rhodococcus sp. BP-149]|uniref:sensor histidine kinase n=1 Tax=unclassified Rhodococcus (in: high G+C Gram-positive bacteria) TaxID=192944 RepID=UPI001C9B12BC|nr:MULTISPECIES: histidine kinase [unclassified Rhodococcus (in: high G+C Gram-positive bacteria)]MBY6687156.1 hypothetical protein [Rhodococcus sp. BP-288]MBY6694421.1 hypothetical protein [Rhodococcus sp. BP-188]MBY6698130.1 hypothetical protein [Rhodococcus sp. BP-285]MBY6704350.1 hypothetical protein [Rhodococcus sp. BP-283]MBY6712999.1 hypothetical protein [Rhodococcus sp. BP-160]
MTGGPLQGRSHVHDRDHTGARAAVAVLLCLYSSAVSVGTIWNGYRTVVALAVTVGLCLPWIWSHVRPRTTFAIMASAGAAQLAFLSGPVPADLVLLAGVHAVALYASQRSALVSAGCVLVGAVIGGIVWGDSVRDVIVPLAAVGAATCAAYTWGRSAAVDRAYRDTLADRAAQLEREKVHLARLAAAEERERIARDMHDVVSHSLAGVLTLAEGMGRAGDLSPVHRRAVRTIAEHCRTSLDEFRTVLTMLRDDGCAGSAPRLCDVASLVERARASGLTVTLDLAADPRTVPVDVQETTFRVVQEALTNIHKHAGDHVSEVAVAVVSGDGALAVTVEDDGCGASSTQTGGYGLRGMRERVSSLGGTVAVARSGTGGFALRVVLPSCSSVAAGAAR